MYILCTYMYISYRSLFCDIVMLSYNNIYNMFCFSPREMVQNIIHRIREKCNITHINNFIYVCFAPSSS